MARSVGVPVDVAHQNRNVHGSERWGELGVPLAPSEHYEGRRHAHRLAAVEVHAMRWNVSTPALRRCLLAHAHTTRDGGRCQGGAPLLHDPITLI